MLMWLLKFNDWINRWTTRKLDQFTPVMRAWTDERFIRTRRDLNWKRMKWQDIHEIWMIRQYWQPEAESYTFFYLFDADEGHLNICDHDKGFTEVVAIFPRKIKNCPADWEKILGSDLEEWKLLWSKTPERARRPEILPGILGD